MLVKYIGDEWRYLDKRAKVVNLQPINGSSQMLVMIDGCLVTVCKNEWVMA